MTVTPERKAELLAELEEVIGKPRAVLVCRDGVIVGDAIVVVSERDPNWWRGMAVRENGEIRLVDGRRLRWR
jgi:hypothetical protein